MNENDFLKKFGQRIKELRIETGLSQEKFALKIEMDRTYFSSVEAGRRNISICNIKKLQMVLEFHYPIFSKILIS